MKKMLLTSVSLLTLLCSFPAMANLAVIDGDNNEIIADETYTSVNISGGSLTIKDEAEIATDTIDMTGGVLNIKNNASIYATDDVNISGGTVNINLDGSSDDTDPRLSVYKELNISGNDTVINLDWGQIEAFGEDTASDRKITIADATINMNMSEIGATIDSDTPSDYDKTGAGIEINSGTFNMNNYSSIFRENVGDIDINGGELNLTNNSYIGHEGKSGDINVADGKINLTSGSKIVIGDFEWDDENMDFLSGQVTTVNLNVTGGEINLNSNSSIVSTDNNTGSVNLDGSAITGATAEDILAQAPKLNVSGNNEIVNSDVNAKDALININKNASLKVDNINLQSGNHASIIDLAGTIDGNIIGSNKAQMTLLDANAKITGTVDLLEDLNINSNISLAQTFIQRATNVSNMTIADGMKIAFDSDNFNTVKQLVLKDGSVATLSKDFTATNKTSVRDGATLDLGINKLTSNNIIFTEGSKLALRIKDENIYGNIEANQVDIANNTSMDVLLDGGIVARDESKDFNLIDSATINGDFSDLINKNNRYEFKHKQDGVYTITGIATASDIVKDSGGSIENISVAGAWLDGGSLAGTKSENIANHLNVLSQKSGGEVHYVNALEALAPTADIATSTSIEQSKQIFKAVGTRMSGGTSSEASQGKSSGDASFGDVSTWAQGMYNETKLDNTSKGKGFDSDTFGLAMGIEKQLNSDVKLGVGYAYAQTDIDAFMTDIEVNSHTGILYGEYKPSQMYINAITSYTFANNEEKKNVAGHIVKADFDVNSIDFQVMTGYEFDMYGYNLTPETGMRYSNIKQESYTDKAGQKVGANSSDIITGIVGTKLDKTFAFDNGMSIRPELKVAMTYDLKNDKSSANVTLANGSKYSTSGKALDKFAVEFGTGVMVDVTDNFEMGVAYEGEVRQDYRSHTGLLNMKYKF